MRLEDRNGTAKKMFSGIFQKMGASVLRILTSLFVPAVTFYVLYVGFMFLKRSEAPAAVLAVVAIIWGVGGVAALYFVANWLIGRFPAQVRSWLQPFLFVGPAMIILGWYLFIPALRSLYLSFFGPNSQKFVGLANYVYCFTDRTMLQAYRNNLLWLVLGTGFSVGFGLFIALLADRCRFEKLAKTIIFMPMAISFVGAAVIWKYVYAYKPPGQPQIGILNAIVTAFGLEPVGWITMRPWNTFFLIAILIWLQSGFAMVILSAAIKGVPKDIIEAGRVDGASELRVVFSIIIPNIAGSIVTVATTILIITLKIWDIVFTMTNGLYGTEVLASQQYKMIFKFLHYGRGSAIAIILLVAVIPVMWYNLKRFGQQAVF
jgi:alpha-glucoside transport system permease protein